CKKLIVKYFYKIDESPDFSLLSDKDEKYLLDTAIKNVFNNHIISGDDDFFELYDCYNSKRNETQLKSMCLNLYNYKCSKIDYNLWKNEFLNSSYNDDLNINSASNYILEHYQKLFLMFSSSIHKLVQKSVLLGLDKYTNYLNFRLQFIDEINKANNFETAVKIVASLRLPNKPTKSKNANVDEISFDEEVDSFNKLFSEQLRKLKEDITTCDIEEIRQSISCSRKNVIKLMDIVDEIESNYMSIKKNKNSLDFNDLENKMLILLQDNEVKSTLQNQYKYIFVDEYQDINDKQENILMNLVSGDNYLMIGDVKQSIYAFRQSSPKIFISKYNNFASDGKSNKLINFNANYRSDRNILEFANSVFDNIITKETIGIDYSKDARFVSDKQYTECNVALNIIDNNDELDDKETSEAIVIAREIARLVSLKRPDGGYYEYGDIAIILRQRGTFVRTLTDILTSMQIPVSASINSDFFNTSEINLMISILQVISNYKNDIAVAVVLKNLFDISEEELLLIRRFDENIPFYDCVRNYNLNEEILTKINNMFDFISTSKKQLLKLTLNEFLTFVINKFNLMLRFKACKNGREKESNILEFLRISENENYKYNLDKFLEYLEFISKEKSLQHIGVDTNAVQICTIHHSKGLEYPIVILGGMGKNFQLNKDSGNMIINNKFGVGLKSIDNINRTLNETIVRNACKIDNKKSEIDEEIRLLYVAMTRAKEKLSIVGTYNLLNLESNYKKRIYSSKNYFDLIFKSLNHTYLPNFLNKKEFVIDEDLPKSVKVRVYKSEDFEENKNATIPQIIFNDGDKELLNNLEKVFINRPNTNVTTIKNTVTNILKEELDYENLNFIPKNLDMTDKVPDKDFLKIGTAYHSVMQALNFTENKAEIKELINRLVIENRIEKELTNYINIEQVFTAVNVLKDLILNAKEIFREKQFLLQENYNKLVKSTDNNTKVIVQGVIDLIVINDEGVYLIDYKTNRGVSEEQLTNEYKLQLELYSYAFEKATNIKVTKKFLYSFSLGKLIEVK
ncbi:MAG: 3'-5' exonuclease, partial [Christensenellales bacterium]